MTDDPWGIAAGLRAVRAEIADLRQEMEELMAGLTIRIGEDPLQPLAKILGVSTRAAWGRLQNDPELRKLGHRLGRRLIFRPSEVRHLLASRANRPRVA